jgi:hypothetical protein
MSKIKYKHCFAQSARTVTDAKFLFFMDFLGTPSANEAGQFLIIISDVNNKTGSTNKQMANPQ